MLLLLGSPMVYAFCARLFTRPLINQEDFRKVWLAQWVAKGMFWAGTVLLILYALTRTWPLPQMDDHGFHGFLHKTLLGFSEDTSLLRPWSWRVLRWLVVETLGRSLFTTVLVADLFMRVNRTMWYYNRELAASPLAKQYERLMGMIERAADTNQGSIQEAGR
jgi:hypothetical protein